MDPGEAFLTALIAGQHEEAGTDENDDDGENDPLEDDASQFSSTSVDDLWGGVIFGNFEPCPGDDRAATDANRATENSSDFENLPNLLDRNLAASENTDDGTTNAATTPTSPTTLHHDNDDAIPKGDLWLITTSVPGRLYSSHLILRLEGNFAAFCSCLQRLLGSSCFRALRQRVWSPPPEIQHLPSTEPPKTATISKIFRLCLIEIQQSRKLHKTSFHVQQHFLQPPPPLSTTPR